MTWPFAPSGGTKNPIAIRHAGVASRLRNMRLCMDRRIRQASHDQSGSSIVEFAVASIILFTLIFGVMAICLALYSYNVTAEAAREATRYAIVRGSHCHFPSGPSCPTSQTDIQNYVRSIPFPGIILGTQSKPTLTATANWVPDNNPGSQVQVTVTYTFPLTIPFVQSRTLSMSSTSQMVISQ